MKIDKQDVKNALNKWCKYVKNEYPESKEAIDLLDAYISYELKINNKKGF